MSTTTGPSTAGQGPLGCDEAEERLALLRYPDELTPAERVAVLAHLEGCAGCRAVRAEDEAAAAALDAAPLRHPSAGRLGGLRAQLLAAVGAAPACPREAELIDDAAPDAAHLAACPACRDVARAFGLVGRALDLARPALPRAALAAQRAALVARLAPARREAARPAPAGRVVRWPGALARTAAAALLLAGVFGAAQRGLRPDPLGSPDLLALVKRGADDLVRSRRVVEDPAALRAAAAGYARVAARRPSEPRTAALAAAAARELAALRALAGVDGASPEARARGLEELLVQFPDAPATFECALASLAPRGSAAVATTAAAATDPRAARPPRAGELRWADMDHSFWHLSGGSLAWLHNPRAQQAVLFQRGLRLEEAGDRDGARACYEDVLARGPEAPAGRLARERLARL